MSTITVDALVKAVSGIDWAKASPSMKSILDHGRLALADFLASQATLREAALQADLVALRPYLDMDALDDFIEQLVETLAIELMQLSSPELAIIAEETGGRTLARMRRAMAADLLKARLT